MDIDQLPQSEKQHMISIAQGELAPIVLKMMRMCVIQQALVAETEWQTIVNTVTMDAQSNMLQNMVQLLEDLRQGAFIKS